MNDVTKPIYSQAATPADDVTRGSPTYIPMPYKCDCGAWYDLRAVKNRATNICNDCQAEAYELIKQPNVEYLARCAAKRKEMFGELRTSKSRADLLGAGEREA